MNQIQKWPYASGETDLSVGYYALAAETHTQQTNESILLAGNYSQ
jgi:hypothetical protein